MGINWILRFKNKVTLTAIIAQVVAIVYAICGMVGVVPAIGENVILDTAYMIVELLCLLGIVVDPTTKGVSDSTQAYNYEEPK